VIDYYDREAGVYDRSRGGGARAAAAADAIERLLPATTRTLVDVGCGTGIVTTRLVAPERLVSGVDQSLGMLARAAGRLPGTALAGDAMRLPLRTASVNAVVVIWLLHLLADAAPVIDEAARVLTGHGVLVTTVDKDQAAFAVASDVAEVTEGLRSGRAGERTDGFERVTALAARHGLEPVAETSFVGLNQGRSPREWLYVIRAGVMRWARGAEAGELAAVCRRLAALPGQDTPRPDPVYRLVAFRT
jgi:SAM-dependent methyltransferase